MRTSPCRARFLRGVALASAALLTPIIGANPALAGPLPYQSSHHSISIGFILKPVNNSYFAYMAEGAKSEAKALGVNLTVVAGTDLTDPTAQTTAANALITHGYSCYIANPINATNLIAPLVRATDQDKPIVNVDLPISQSAAKAAGVHILTYIGTNNVTAGVTSAHELAKYIPHGSQIAVIGGPLTDPTSIPRVRGFHQGAAKEGLKVVADEAANWDTTTALDDAAAILEKYPKLAGFLVANETMATGVQRAIQNAHMQGKVDQVAIIGVKYIVQDVATHIMPAAVEQFPYVIGKMGVEACVAAVLGKRLPTNVATPLEVVTSSNAAKEVTEFPKPTIMYSDPFTALLHS